MSKDRGPWRLGRRAKDRLDGWHQDSPSARPGNADDGAGALEALADVGFVRHLLDQAEPVAVRTARRHGKSWDDARVALGKVSLIGLGPNPDGPPNDALIWPDARVVDQSPESGARVPAGSTVTLWVERGGGGAGVREPRRPLPGPLSSDEAVS